MEANKEESQRCIEIAKQHLRENNREKALKFLNKAQALNPNDEMIANLIKQTEKPRDGPTQNGSATGDYGAFTDQYETHTRSRFHGSKSEANFSKQHSAGSGEASSSNENDSSPSKERVRSKSRNRTSSASAGSGAGAGVHHRATSSPQLGVDYTQEQVEAVQRVRKSKDYYEILNVKKDFSDNDLKKQYRKLALQFHPDKNRAPGATEAFKAIGNAYAVLSDPKKRERYDMYGTQAESSNSHHRHSHYDYSRGFEADMTAEEIFNMFFGGGFPQGNLRRQHGGHYYYQHSAEGERRNESSLGVLLQLMPILILVFLSVFSQLLVADPHFSLQRNNKYTEERRTTELNVVYYVKPDFKKQYDKNNINRIERLVEEEYIDNLRSACFRERSQKETMLWRAKLYGDAGLYEKAQYMRTPSCDKLSEIYR